MDVARFGSDSTIIASRHGARIRIREAYVGRDTTHTAARVLHWRTVLREESQADPVLVVDDVGVGGGVTDQLRAGGLEVRAFNAGARAHRPSLYPNRRSEMWFTLADALDGLDLDDDDQLTADLTSTGYRYDAQMRKVVEPKADTKKRLGRSPDRADAVMLTLAVAAEHERPKPWRPRPAQSSPAAGAMKWVW